MLRGPSLAYTLSFLLSTHRGKIREKRTFRWVRLKQCTSVRCLHQRPDFLWFERHIECGDTQRRQGVQGSIDHCRGRTDTARLTGSFCSQRVVRRRRLDEISKKRGQHAGIWQGVVHQRTAQELAILIIKHFFVQSLTDALRQPAMELVIDQTMIEHASAIVYR